jgi:CheY-like chemotaxis protein
MSNLPNQLPFHPIQNQFQKTAPLVLMADDDMDDREFFISALAEIAPTYQLIMFSDGDSLLDYINELPEQQLPCLIVLDFNMPRMDGLHTLQALGKQDRYKHIPKVIFSTSLSDKTSELCIENGAYAYKTKPGKMQDLKQIIKEIIDYCDAQK